MQNRKIKKIDMDCKTLCELLVKQKDEAQVRLKDSLPYILQLSSKKIEAIERGFSGFNVNDMMLYINMCNSYIHLIGWEDWIIRTVDELRECFMREREMANVSIRQLARSVKVPIVVIEAFEKRDGGLRIDSFLDITDTLNIEISFD